MFLLEPKRARWDQILNMSTWPEDFIKVVKNIWFVTNSSKLRSFQFRLLNHAIITNVQLKKWGILNSDLCTFCDRDKETIVHLFWECVKVKPIWEKIIQWVHEMNPDIVVNLQSVILNNVHNNPKCVINTIVLIAKFYLYKTKCAQMQPNPFALLEDVLLYQRLEHIGACKKGKQNQSKEKWQFVIEIIKRN